VSDMTTGNKQTEVRAATTLGKLLLIAAGLLFLAGGALVLVQCLGWLLAGEWQPVPAWLTLLESSAQQWHKAYEGRLCAIDYLPSLASYASLSEIAPGLKAKAAGVHKILIEALSLPLLAWLWGLAFIAVWLGGNAADSQMVARHHNDA
jgi:hypothetical protein